MKLFTSSVFTSADPKHTATLRPDSLLRLWRYINPLLVVLLRFNIFLYSLFLMLMCSHLCTRVVALIYVLLQPKHVQCDINMQLT